MALTDKLTAIANAIRAKTGGTATMTLAEMPTEIASIQTGITPSGSLPITENGTYDVTQYAEANVNVSGGTEIADGIVVKARNSSGYATEVELYSADGIAYPYMFYNGYKAASWNYEQVTWNSCNLLTIKSQLTSIKNSAFKAFPGDIVGDFSQVVDMEHQEGDGYAGISIFGSSGIVSISMDSLTVLGGSAFGSCKSLKSAYFPKVTNVYNKWDAGAGRATFGGCSALESIQLGSIGTQCLLANNQAFLGCTNENLIVTLYCNSQNADTQVARIRNGATNATIIIKDSTTGDVIVTSTP